MSELSPALISIAGGNEFLFARFYHVYEGVQLVLPESPPIVSGVSDMHPSDCPNVEETRNPMQTFSWKKCSHFSQTNFHLHFHMKSPSVFLIILLIKAGRNMLIAAIPCKRVRMEHIRPLHVSMRIRLCFMLTFVSANIMLQTVDSGLCTQKRALRPAK